MHSPKQESWGKRNALTSTQSSEEFWACVLFICIGVGYLFPFSALTQPVDYWNKLFPEFDIDFPITATYMWVNLIFLGLLVFMGDPTKSYDMRMYGGFLGQFVALMVVPSSYFLYLSEESNFYVVIGSTFFAAAVTACIDSCAISLSCQYPKSCQEALQVGIGMSTLIGSVYRLLTKAFFSADQVVESSLLYFYGGAVTVLGCVYAYWHLKGMNLTRQALAGLLNTGDGGEEQQLLEEGGKKKAKKSYGIFGGGVKKEAAAPVLIDKVATFRKALFNESMVFIVFASTLSLWPPFVSEIKSFSYPYLNETKWWPLILLFCFALMDVAGRFCVPYRCGLTKDNIWIPVIIRAVVFIPLIISLVKFPVLESDLFSVVSVAVLGFTNGYLGSLSIILVNERVSPEERGVVGALTGFVLNFGLLVGATVAILLQDFIM